MKKLLKLAVLIVVVAVVINRLPGWLQEQPTVPAVTGTVQPGWQLVKEEYEKLFAEGEDRGSNLAVYHKGRLVVDLRGGFANEKELWPWQEDTVTRIFSSTKGIGAICVALLVDRGLMKYTDKVVKYWPEFGANGKQDVTIETLLSHQAGVITITDDSYTLWDEVKDLNKLEKLLATQKPLWKPGTGVGYHALTIGLYMDQLVRHVDPQHRSLPQFFQDEIAKPFGIDLQFGLPDSQMYRATTLETLPFVLRRLTDSGFFSMFLGHLFSSKDAEVPYSIWEIVDNMDDKSVYPYFMRMRPDVLKLWNPSVMGQANGRALAKLYGILANGGSHEGKTLMSPATIKLQTDIIKTGLDKLLHFELSYGRGYAILNSPRNSPMFGTPGLGGQIGYADPANQLGLGYTSNYLSNSGLLDHRYTRLHNAIYKCIEKLS